MARKMLIIMKPWKIRKVYWNTMPEVECIFRIASKDSLSPMEMLKRAIDEGAISLPVSDRDIRFYMECLYGTMLMKWGGLQENDSSANEYLKRV